MKLISITPLYPPVLDPRSPGPQVIKVRPSDPHPGPSDLHVLDPRASDPQIQALSTSCPWHQTLDLSHSVPRVLVLTPLSLGPQTITIRITESRILVILGYVTVCLG